jgi:hypothetical protein
MPDQVQSNTAGGGAERNISDGDKALAQSWNKKITAAKKTQKYEDFNKSLKKLRMYVNGTQHDDGAPGLVRTNLIFASLQTLLPYVYAKNPDIAVTPTEAVGDGQYEAVRKFCTTLEIVLRRQLVRDAQLKKREKANVRGTMTTGIGWLKVLYQRDYKTDPIIQNRIADIQDNLKRLEYLMVEVESGVAADRDAKKAELEEQLKALEQKLEVIASEGLVIDRVLSEDMLVLDEGLRDFDMYPQSRAIAHGIWFTKESYKETFGHDAPATAAMYSAPTEAKDAQSNGDQQFVRVWEIWDRISQTIYTIVEGAQGFCRPPYQPQRQGKRWYPFFALAFNPVDGQFMPLSDVALLKELQDEYNTTRTNFAEHRKEHIPGTVVRAGGQLTPEDIKRITERKINETIVVQGDGGKPLSDDIQNIGGSPIEPQVYDVSPIRNDMDLVVGLSDASRSNLIQAKTATEAEIMKEGLMTRTAERQDAIEDHLQEMAQYGAEVLLQELTPEQVSRIAGPGYAWPVMSKDDIFDLVSIEIRAGSTGKPNKMRERQQWVEFMPTLEDTVQKITDLRAQGHADLAQGLVEILKETLKRFDERLDLDTFLPKQKAGTPEQAMLEAAQQRISMLEQQIQQLSSGDQVEYARIDADERMNTQDNDTELAVAAMRNGAAAARPTNNNPARPQVATVH